jgi:UDP-glucose-4-epimerase GalE
MRVLVAGGAGYIGSHMMLALRKAGAEALVFDNFSTGHREAVEGMPLYQGDLLNADDIDRAITDFRPNLVMHFAASTQVAESMIAPAVYHNNNVLGVMNLLEAMRKHGCLRLVFSSTAAVYGMPSKRRIDEDHPTTPINTYGWTKLFAERMIDDHCRAYGLRAAVLRYFNAAGADASGMIGESHEPESHLIPNVLKVAAGKAEKVLLFGNDHDTRDGYCVRDYVHVTDLCDAHLLAAKSLEQLALPDSQFYNLGNGQGYSVLEVLQATETVLGRKLPTELAAKRPGDPPVLVASYTKAHATLGWQPKFSDIHDIIRSAWRWHQSSRY